MPNTLAHLGVQALIGRALFPRLALGWVWLGCILPDLPWIAQRAVRTLVPGVPLLDLRLWAIAQSSLLFCLIGAAGFAWLSRRPAAVFAILALGSLLHLLLDAAQTKWANGVVLWAPVDWSTTNVGWFWPEDWPTLALTALGLVVFGLACLRWRGVDRPTGSARPLLAAALLSLWVFGPILVLGAVEADGAHHVDVLRDRAGRDGAAVGFDRARLVQGPDGAPELRVWTGERFAATGPMARAASGRVSVTGRFEGADQVRIEALHSHLAGWRDLLSYVGLGLVSLWWAASGVSRVVRRRGAR